MQPNTGTSPNLQKLQTTLKDLRGAGINDRGKFKGEVNTALNGFARLTFLAPKLSSKPSTLKSLISPDELNKLKLEIRNTETALNDRDSAVAELAQDNSDLPKVAALAQHLADQGVKLDGLSWTMGATKLDGSREDGNTVDTLQTTMARRALSKLDSSWDKLLKLGMTPAAMEVLQMLRKGLGESVVAAQLTGEAMTSMPNLVPAGQPQWLIDGAKNKQLQDQINMAEKALQQHDMGVNTLSGQELAAVKEKLRALQKQLHGLEATDATTPRPPRTTTNTTTTTTTTAASNAANSAQSRVSPEQPKPLSAQMGESAQEKLLKLKAEEKKLLAHINGAQGKPEASGNEFAMAQLRLGQIRAQIQLAGATELSKLKTEKSQLEQLVAYARTDYSPISRDLFRAALSRMDAIDGEIFSLEDELQRSAPKVAVGSAATTTQSTTTQSRSALQVGEILDIAIALLQRSLQEAALQIDKFAPGESPRTSEPLARAEKNYSNLIAEMETYKLLIARPEWVVLRKRTGLEAVELGLLVEQAKKAEAAKVLGHYEFKTPDVTLSQRDAAQRRLDEATIAIANLEEDKEKALQTAAAASARRIPTTRTTTTTANTGTTSTTTTTNVAPSAQNLASTGQPQPSTPRNT